MTEEPPIFIDWIDDDFGDQGGDRNALPDSLMREANDKISIQAYVPAQIDTWLDDIQNGKVPKPDILLIDYRLKSSEAGKKNTPPAYDNGRKLGSMLQYTVVASTPKYLVSRIFDNKQVGIQPEAFDWVFDQVSLIASGRQLLNDGQDYRQVLKRIRESMDSEKSASESVDEMAQEISVDLKTPSSEHSNISEFLANEFDSALREYFDAYNLDREIAIEQTGVVSLHVSRWIRGVFLKRNGPLIDDLLGATLFGVKLEYFNSTLQPIIEESTQGSDFFPFSGLFHVGETRRWWRQELVSWGLDRFNEIEIDSTSRMAEQFARFLEVPDENQSVCAVCREKWPDTIARDAELVEETHMRQVHRGCSSTIKGQMTIPGFDELREFESE